MPKDLQGNAFKLLEKISPIKGKKAVFITAKYVAFSKEIVAKNLKDSVNAELKDYLEVTNIEDFKASVTKYSADPEVGWILTGTFVTALKDGSKVSDVEVVKWFTENCSKPTINYWEMFVKSGVLGALGVDLTANGTQAGEIAVRVLKGESIKDIKAEGPKTIVIVLNQKTAKKLNIEFPADVLGSAAKVYAE